MGNLGWQLLLFLGTVKEGGEQGAGGKVPSPNPQSPVPSYIL